MRPTYKQAVRRAKEALIMVDGLIAADQPAVAQSVCKQAIASISDPIPFDLAQLRRLIDEYLLQVDDNIRDTCRATAREYAFDELTNFRVWLTVRNRK